MLPKRPRGSRVAPPQEIKGRAITDPVELEAIQERLRKSRIIDCFTGEVTPPHLLTAAEVLDWTKHLPTKERFLLTTLLAAQLPAAKRQALVEQLATSPAPARQRRAKP